jgi:glycosyltransferase involved in cell wall biosynthesis
MRASAIITTFNRSALLAKAMRSVLAQDLADLELIVLDNSSTDDTAATVASFADPRIVYVRHPQLGISEARNLGVRTARGEFVGFLDDDDEWLPHKLSRQIEMFDRASSKVGLVYGGFDRVTPDGNVYATFTPTLRGDFLERFLCDGDPFTGSASNPLIKKECFEKVGMYREDIKTSEDWEFYLRLGRSYECEFVPEPVLRIRWHPGPRLGDRTKDAAETQLAVLTEFKDIFDRRPLAKSRYLQEIGGKFIRGGEISLGRSYLRQALGVNPANFTAWAQLAISFAGQGIYARAHKLYKRLVK